MKIVYIGASDGLAEELAELLVKEGNDFYLLSDKELPGKPRAASKHRFYRSPRKGESFGKLLLSISPDLVVFAGNHYISSGHEEESEEDVTLLSRTLRTAIVFPQVRFILLSSIEVNGDTGGRGGDELMERAAISERGIRFIREEQLLDIYRRRYGIDAVTLRASQLYTNRPSEGGGDFLSRSFDAAVQAEDCRTNNMFQPLHVSDFVDAVRRVMNEGKESVYNVCGSVEISADRLYQLICAQEKLIQKDVRWEAPAYVAMADSGRIRRELGWNDSQDLEKLMQDGGITYERTLTEKRKGWKKKWVFPVWLRKLAENLLIFTVFFALHSVCASSELFSKIDWLTIYVILIAVSYNIFQSTLAGILASAAYLYSRNLNILELNTFYSYADSALTVMMFIFIGLIVSYTIDIFREEAKSARLDLEMIKEEYDDLKDINEENVLIKNEYEERILTSKTGLSKLYSMISRLMVQEPDRILMETIQVISELFRTDTVAVYQGQLENPQFHLVGALSDSSAMNGKTWNLSEYPRIYDAVERGELYQGELGSGEPAAVVPIVCGGVSAAVVLIKTLPYECETLYHFNLLKTVSLLLRDAMEKALQYEEMSREMYYVMGTDILRPEEFHKRVLVAKEKAEKSIAEYCVMELLYFGSLEETAYGVSQILPVTDCMGIDEEYKLYALLNNIDSGSVESLRERLLNCGVETRLVSEEQAMI